GRGLDARHHFRKAGVDMVMMAVSGCREPEAQAVQPGARARLEDRRAGSGRQHSGGIPLHAAAQVRQGVNHGGDKHVPRPPAHRVKPDCEVHPLAKTGTTYGPSGIKATSGSSWRAIASRNAVSTFVVMVTPVMRRSSSSSPVV